MVTSKAKGTSPLSPADIIRLHEFEMTYPMSTILQFREVAVAVFNAQDLFMQRKKSKSANRSKKQFSQALSWRDVLSMLTILKEEQRGVISYVSPAAAAAAAGGADTHRAMLESVDEDFDGSSVGGSVGAMPTGGANKTSLGADFAAESWTVPESVPEEDSVEQGDVPMTVSVPAELEPVESMQSVSTDSKDAAPGPTVTAVTSAIAQDSKETVATTPSQEVEKKKSGFQNMIRKSLAVGGSSSAAASPDGSSITPTTREKRDSVSAGASKLFSSIRHSTGMTPESRTGTPAAAANTSSAAVGADESAKNGTKAAASKPNTTGASPSVRKTAMLSTMSAVMSGKTSSSSSGSVGSILKTSNEDSQLGEKRFNTLLARTLQLSESTDGFGECELLVSRSPLASVIHIRILYIMT
jgi:hypothetical protein